MKVPPRGRSGAVARGWCVAGLAALVVILGVADDVLSRQAAEAAGAPPDAPAAGHRTVMLDGDAHSAQRTAEAARPRASPKPVRKSKPRTALAARLLRRAAAWGLPEERADEAAALTPRLRWLPPLSTHEVARHRRGTPPEADDRSSDGQTAAVAELLAHLLDPAVAASAAAAAAEAHHHPLAAEAAARHRRSSDPRRGRLSPAEFQALAGRAPNDAAVQRAVAAAHRRSAVRNARLAEALASGNATAYAAALAEPLDAASGDAPSVRAKPPPPTLAKDDGPTPVPRPWATTGPARPMFYVESGASDGLWVSNTLFFARRHGWEGLLVEPDLALFAKLRGNRHAAWAMRGYLDRESGEQRFDPGKHVGSGQLIRQEIVRSVDLSSNESTVPCERLDATLLAIGRRRVDYLSLDVEGAEMAVLAGLNLTALSVAVLTIEFRIPGNPTHPDNFEKLKALRTHLSDRHGYLFVGCLPPGCVVGKDCLDALFVEPALRDAAVRLRSRQGHPHGAAGAAVRGSGHHHLPWSGGGGHGHRPGERGLDEFPTDPPLPVVTDDSQSDAGAPPNASSAPPST